MQNKGAPQKTYTYTEVLDAYNKLQNMPPKERYKFVQTVAAMAVIALKNEHDEDNLPNYIKIFKEAGRNKEISIATKKLYEIKGFTELKTVKTKSGVVNIESGMLALGDPKFGLDVNEPYETADISKAENDGRFITAGTGGDGNFDIVVRLINLPEPVISDKEIKYIEYSTEPRIIRIESGKVVCGDLWSIKAQDGSTFTRVELSIENGTYKAAVFNKVMKGKFGYVAILSAVSS